MESLLEFKNVSYSYPDGQDDHPVLKDTSYSFEKGKVYAIVGSSGSGKTTTLALASGLDSPQEGKILYKQEDISQIGLTKYRKEKMTIVFQSYNLIYYMNALDNVMLALDIAHKKIKNKKEYCLQILDQLGISKDMALRDVRKLSGGQQQRVAIARAIVKDTDLILADEPTGNLDEDNALEVMKLFIELAHQENKCVIIVSHSLTLASMCDQQLKIKNEKLIDYFQ
ncbi:MULTISPECIES: ABC transporter ATP-binding protein [Coprobacillaceae]|uniref:ABC transporter ATP-binding protein n=1 Tax=Coprobacillaceae TaxID=2810280 RepID=UPI000E46DD32|nr:MULTISPECIES: ABC transporter ATP-binding protein [Coprobacillaceae]RHM63126.1 ABC transporter ATP-binding protein [Coprobacillus sp. AF33-1AC]RHS93225.1 ABC transporter ATP-binding protein [Erysipelatoclostridium sp. AM42-17]